MRFQRETSVFISFQFSGVVLMGPKIVQKLRPKVDSAWPLKLRSFTDKKLKCYNGPVIDNTTLSLKFPS